MDNPAEAESISGTSLVRALAKRYFDAHELEVYTPKYEKPKAFLGDNELSISFSHTKNALTAVISFEYLVGCDIERVDRKVSAALIDRMRCEDESDELYDQFDPIRIWTCKEAALKMIGTGLRKPMKSVNMSQISPNLLIIEFNDGIRAKICSFQHRNYWISICYK